MNEWKCLFRRFIFFLGIQIASFLCDHICSLQYIGTKKEKERVTLERSVIEQSGAGLLGVRYHNVFTSAIFHVAKTDEPILLGQQNQELWEYQYKTNFVPKEKSIPMSRTSLNACPECYLNQVGRLKVLTSTLIWWMHSSMPHKHAYKASR